MLEYPDAFEPGFQEVHVAAEARDVDAGRIPPPRRGEDRVVDRVVHEAGRELTDGPPSALADEERVLQERIARDDLRLQIQRVDVLHPHLLQAVAHEHAREIGNREAKRRRCRPTTLRYTRRGR